MIIIKLKLKTIQGVKQTMTIGRIKKPICVIMASLVLILGTFAIALPYQEADAGVVVDKIQVQVIVWRGDTLVASYIVDISPSCGNTCAANLDLKNRDSHRFDRWCPSNPTDVVIDEDGFESIICDGKGPWFIEVKARTLSSANQNVPNLIGDITVSVMGS